MYSIPVYNMYNIIYIFYTSTDLPLLSLCKKKFFEKNKKRFLWQKKKCQYGGVLKCTPRFSCLCLRDVDTLMKIHTFMHTKCDGLRGSLFGWVHILNMLITVDCFTWKNCTRFRFAYVILLWILRIQNCAISKNIYSCWRIQVSHMNKNKLGESFIHIFLSVKTFTCWLSILLRVKYLWGVSTHNTVGILQ